MNLLSKSLQQSVRALQYTPQITEEVPMTLQVAIVATDGIVVGSDRLIRNTEPYLNCKTLTYQGSKIFRDDSRRVMACWSGENPSKEFAKAVISLPDEQLQNLAALHELADRIFAQESEKFGVGFGHSEVLLVMARALDRINPVRVQGTSVCFPIYNKVIAGNTALPSVYFVERFFREGLTMEQLTPLIAHMISDAGRAKDSGVEGLEIVYCSEAGLRPLDRKQISELEEMSKGLETKIINHLMPMVAA